MVSLYINNSTDVVMYLEVTYTLVIITLLSVNIIYKLQELVRRELYICKTKLYVNGH